MKHPRIAIVLCHPGDSLGAETREGFLAHHLISRGFDVRLYRVDVTGKVTPDMVSVRQFYKIAGTSKPTTLSLFAADDLSVPVSQVTSEALCSALALFEPDLVVWKGLNYAIAGQAFTLHDSIGDALHVAIVGGNLRDDFLLAKCSHVFTEFAGQLDPGVFQSVLPKWVNWNRIKHSESRLCGSNVWSWVSVGEVCARKNHLALVEKWDAAAKGSGHRGVIIGDGQHMPALASACEGSLVLARGDLPNELVLDNMLMSRFQIHPSLREGMPRCMVEGAACGLPFICLKDAIRFNEELPFVVRCDTVDDMVEVALSWLSGDVSLGLLSSYAWEWGATVCAWDSLVSTFVERIDQLLKRLP